ncbi:methyltransferase domain-containing protein [Oscillospiraceae bacterium WX1]
MTQPFDPVNMKKLDNEARIRLLAPRQTLIKLGYKQGDSLADIGCGTGVFTLPAADIGGSSAVIYAIDISEAMLHEVARRALESGLRNIMAIPTNGVELALDDQSVDFVLLCTVLHEVAEPEKILAEAFRICRPGGKIAVIDFNATDQGFGPPLHHRLPADRCCALLKSAGFSETEETAVSAAFYVVTGVRAPRLETDGLLVK